MANSDTLSIKIKNEAKIARAWKNAPADLSKELAEGLRQVAVFLTGKTKEVIASGQGMWKAPLDTGALRRGIHPVFEGAKARIVPSSHTPYAQYVHEGTSSMRPRPFFEITKDSYSDEAMEFINKRIGIALNKLSIR